MELELLKKKLDEQDYICDDDLATVLFVALKLGRPLLIEGAAGVGKTQVAKVMASLLDRDLVRLQCYEGLDESKALYEWNYQKQLLSIQVNMGNKSPEELTRSLFSDEYLLERPLLRSIRSEKEVVLLIDEIDKADEEFEAFLLELLSEMQVSIPEIGTVKSRTTPFVVLTSNRTRPLSDALRRRCAYLYIDYPSVEKELAILRRKLPHVDDRLCAQVALAVQKLAGEGFTGGHVAVRLDPHAAHDLPAAFGHAGADFFQHFGIVFFDPLIITGAGAGEHEFFGFVHAVQCGAEGRLYFVEALAPLPEPHGIDMGVADHMHGFH